MWCSFQPFSSCKPLRMPWKQKRSSTTWILRRSSKYLIITASLLFHQQHHHQQTSSSWLLWSSAATSRTIYTAILCTKAEALSALSSTAAKLFSHCLLITIPFGAKHFRSECVFSVDINGLFLTLSKSWLPLPKFRLNCLGSFFSVETYWTAGLTLKNHHNGFSIKPIQKKEMPITKMQNTSIIWLNCKALPF